MLINSNFIQLPDEPNDFYKKPPNFYRGNEFINNLMLNPKKYHEFKRNINRINNIDNEINYLKSIEKKNEIDFVNNIIITEEEYNNALKYADIIFENLNEEQINDLLSHKKLLSYEKHLIETMVYFLDNQNFDWNIFKLSFSLYEAKTKMKNIDYSKIKKRKINLLLRQLCHCDKMNKFLNMNNFCDSGMEFVYEWVKCQLKIYFYLYQNKKICNKIKTSKSMINVHRSKIIKNNINEELFSDNTGVSNLNSSNCNLKNEQMKIIESIILKNSTDNDTMNNNNILSNSNEIKSNNISSIYNMNERNKKINVNKSMNENIPLLLTSLPDNIINKGLKKIEESTILSNNENKLKNKIHIPIEPKKVNIRIKGFNKEKEKLIKEMRTAEMLPLLKNKTYHQMRNYFDDKLPFNKKLDKKIKMEINSYSLNGTNDEKKLVSLIASGKIKTLNFESLFKLKKTLGS